MVTNAYFNPKYGRLLPLGSRERTLISVSLRSFWHLIFDPCPRVLKIANNKDASNIFEPFLEWADEKKLSMGWSLHLHLLEWLIHISMFSDRMTEDLVKELLAASAARWAKTDISDHRCILIASLHMKSYLVSAFKSRVVTESFRVELMRSNKEIHFKSCQQYLLSKEGAFHRLGSFGEVPV